MGSRGGHGCRLPRSHAPGTSAQDLRGLQALAPASAKDEWQVLETRMASQFSVCVPIRPAGAGGFPCASGATQDRMPRIPWFKGGSCRSGTGRLQGVVPPRAAAPQTPSSPPRPPWQSVTWPSLDQYWPDQHSRVRLVRADSPRRGPGHRRWVL